MKRERNSFLTPLDVRVQPSGKTFKLLNPFTYRWAYREDDLDFVFTFVVPRWFETDFASIPRFARVLIPKLGRHNKAAVIHDYIYQSDRLLISRKKADQCFLAGMTDLGVAKWKRTLMYWAVRIGGFFAWTKPIDWSNPPEELRELYG